MGIQGSPAITSHLDAKKKNKLRIVVDKYAKSKCQENAHILFKRTKREWFSFVLYVFKLS